MLSANVVEQILELRASGVTNMFDSNRVQVEADRRGFYHLVIFIEEHKGDYARFILTGER